MKSLGVGMPHVFGSKGVELGEGMSGSRRPRDCWSGEARGGGCCTSSGGSERKSWAVEAAGGAGSRGAGSRHLGAAHPGQGAAQPGVEGKQPHESYPWLFEAQHLIDVLCAAFSSMRSMKELVQDVKMKNEVFKTGVKLSSKSNGTYTKVQIAESIVKCRPDSVTNAHELLSWLVVSCVNSNVAGLVL